MMTYVYLMGQEVRVLQGHPARQPQAVSSASLRLADGCLINGIVTDEEVFKKQLAAFWAEKMLPKRDVTLVINSTDIAARTLHIPKAVVKNPSDFLVQEFAENARDEESVYDLVPAGKTTEGDAVPVIGMQCPRSFITGYVELFESIGVKVRRIMPAICCVINLMDALGTQNEPYAMLIIDGETLTGALWVDGRYAYSQRIRLFSDEGTREFGQEIARSFDSLMQFYTTLHNPKPLKKAFLWEPDAGRYSVYAQELEQLGVEVHRYMHEGVRTGVNASEHDMVYIAGALIRAKHEVDFTRSTGTADKAERKTSVKSKRILILAVPAMIMAVAWLVLQRVNAVRQAELDEIDAYMMSLNVRDSLALADDVDTGMIVYNEKITALNTANEAIASYPLMNTAVRDAILSCRIGGGSLSLTEYYSESGRLLFTASVEKPEDANVFIAALDKTELFSRVNYVGYSYIEDTDDYRINVECYLMGTAGR